MVRSIVIDGKRFAVLIRAEPLNGSWQWRIAGVGGFVLSGEASSEMQALRSACRAGRVLARVAA